MEAFSIVIYIGIFIYHHHPQILWNSQTLSLAIPSYHPSLQVGLFDCILCPHRVEVCKSLLVSQP